MPWFAGLSLTAFPTSVFVPWLIFKFFKPEITDTAPARELSRAELARIGPLTRDEKWLIAIMLAVMAGWVTNNLEAFHIFSLRIPNPWYSLSNPFVALARLPPMLTPNCLTPHTSPPA